MKSKVVCWAFGLLMTSAGVLHGGDRKTCIHHGPGEDIYKHYTGTIGNRKVVLDLRYGYCGSSNYGGSYFYYPDDDKLRCFMIGEPARFDHNMLLEATEVEIGGNWPEAIDNEAKWAFTIKDDHLSGEWTSGDKKTTLPISLEEDYSAAVRMDVMTFEDSAQTMRPRKPIHTAYYNYIGVKPSANTDKAATYLVTEEILKLTDVDKAGVTELEILPSAIAQRSVGNFTKKYGQLPDDTTRGEWKASTFSFVSLLFPIYNDKGLLSLEYSTMGSLPEKHVCIDISRNKALKMADILIINEKLTTMLETEYARKMKQGASGTVKAVPDNFIVTGTGIVFCYPALEESSWGAGIKIFIPYSRLGNMLTKDFRIRMGV